MCCEDGRGKTDKETYNLISMSDVPNEKEIVENEYILLRLIRI